MNRFYDFWILNTDFQGMYITLNSFSTMTRYNELKAESWDFLSQFRVFGYDQMKDCVMLDKKYGWSLLATQTQAHKKERQNSINFNNQSKLFARSAQFLHISLLSLHDYDVKTPNLTL